MAFSSSLACDHGLNSQSIFDLAVCYYHSLEFGQLDIAAKVAPE